MTAVLRSVAVPLQVVGLLGSVIGLAGSWAAPAYCSGFLYVPVGIVCVALDLVALKASPSIGAILVVALKLVVLVLPSFVLLMCAPSDIPLAEPVVPTWLGPTILLASSIPSILGAILRRLSR